MPIRAGSVSQAGSRPGETWPAAAAGAEGRRRRRREKEGEGKRRQEREGEEEEAVALHPLCVRKSLPREQLASRRSQGTSAAAAGDWRPRSSETRRGGGGSESSASRRRPGGACCARSRFGSQRRRREARLPGPVRAWPHGAAPARSEVRGLAQRCGRPWARGRAHWGAGVSHLLAGAKDAQGWEGRLARRQGRRVVYPLPGPAVRTTSPAGLTAAAAGPVGSMCMSP